GAGDVGDGERDGEAGLLAESRRGVAGAELVDDDVPAVAGDDVDHAVAPDGHARITEVAAVGVDGRAPCRPAVGRAGHAGHKAPRLVPRHIDAVLGASRTVPPVGGEVRLIDVRRPDAIDVEGGVVEVRA